MDPLLDEETVDDGAGIEERAQSSLPPLEPVCEPLREPHRADLRRRGGPVVRHAMERQPLGLQIQHGIARGGVAIARLAGGADDREPLVAGRDGDRDAGHRLEGDGAIGERSV